MKEKQMQFHKIPVVGNEIICYNEFTIMRSVAFCKK